MKRTTRIELFKENFKFSSGHFTIFSRTERENLHGHNFRVYLAMDVTMEENGIVVDYYTHSKLYLETMCKALNEYFLLPEHSKFLTFSEEGGYVYAHFDTEKIPFLKRDIKILPIDNISVEALSGYFLEEFMSGFIAKNRYPVSRVEVKIYSGPGQSANAVWTED